MATREAAILFPIKVLPRLRDLRGGEWAALVDCVLARPEASLEAVAISLLMVRLASCLTCHSDSYRALKGCTFCAQQALRRFRGDDGDLLVHFEMACADVVAYSQAGRVDSPLGDVLRIEVLNGP